MKFNTKSLGVKLWAYFALLAAAIFAVLWLCQTVFLQTFYDRMVIRNIQAAAKQIAAQMGRADFGDWLDDLAYENSLLIFLTDAQGNVLYSTDEHSGAYRGETAAAEDTRGNPYHPSDKILNWQIGAGRHLNLPPDFSTFMERLNSSENGTVGYRLTDGSTYIYGTRLGAASGESILYISAALEAVGATVSILRTQLVWITGAALLFAFGIALLISRRFTKPVAALDRQARKMAEGGGLDGVERGFCSELDGLADTLYQTAAALNKAEQSRKEFLANISRDLRTPLTMIRGYAEMVRDISWEDETQRENDLAIIIRETNRLTELVNDILELTALQSQTQAAQYGEVDLSAAAQDVIRQFTPLCEQRGCVIKSELESGQFVRGEPVQLSRVLYNLIDNAISHAGEPQIVHVSLKRVGQTARVEVQDHGEGIPPEEIPYVWERYFTSKQRKSKREHSGLGLAISKEILLAHGAKFGVNSAIGQGSCFWFEMNVVAAVHPN